MIRSTSSTAIPCLLKRQVLICVRQCLDCAKQKLEQSFKKPDIIIRKKGTIAGTAHLQTWTITLNAQLLLDYQDDFIREIVPHELAHLFVYALYGKVKPHGKEWQWMMKTILGLPAKRTHQFTNTKLQQIRFQYHCDCQVHSLTSIRHARIIRNQTIYRCVRCQQKLQWG